MDVGNWVRFTGYSEMISDCAAILDAGDIGCLVRPDGKDAWTMLVHKPVEQGGSVTELVFENEIVPLRS